MTKTLKKMTALELTTYIEELEAKKFQHMMADHWDAEDYAYDTKLFNQIQLAKKNLKIVKKTLTNTKSYDIIKSIQERGTMKNVN